MTLQVDTSEPFLRPSQLIALVHAVHNAAGHNEHRWIEWKSSLDLASATGQAHIAKAVIGLANRQPAAAVHHAGGYGYLLVGVEPGALAGVTPIDPATLVGKLRALVGDALRWTPEYVTIGSAEILVVVVDPPQPGHLIHHLRRAIERHQAGTIFVRHAGRTDPATPSDLEMLQARLLERTPSLQLTVTAIPSTIEASPDILGAAEQWVQHHQPVLLAARHQSPPQRTKPPFHDLVEVSNALSGIFPPKVIPDQRTEDEYTAEVEKYLKQAKSAFVERAMWDLYRHSAALLNIQVANPTDLGYTGVQLVIHIPGGIMSYSDQSKKITADKRAAFPTSPLPLGTPSVERNDFLTQMTIGNSLHNYNSYLELPNFTRDIGSGPGYTVRDTGSVDIEYREFDIRPEDTYICKPVPLLVLDNPGTTLTATWHATAADVRGRLSGEFQLTITNSTLDLTNIDCNDEKDSR